MEGLQINIVQHPVQISKVDPGNNAPLQLCKISINEEYRVKWNIHENDFLCLTKNGHLISNSLYRTGMFTPNLKEDKYFLLMKHVEAFYDDSITKDSKRKHHLESRWCILDSNGVEKVVFPSFKTPYLIKDSCIYAIENKYYNIENGEYYGTSYSNMQSIEFLFLEKKYDDDKSKRGVMKINKKDGSWELFSEN